MLELVSWKVGKWLVRRLSDSGNMEAKKLNRVRDIHKLPESPLLWHERRGDGKVFNLTSDWQERRQSNLLRTPQLSLKWSPSSSPLIGRISAFSTNQRGFLYISPLNLTKLSCFFLSLPLIDRIFLTSHWQGLHLAQLSLVGSCSPLIGGIR